MIESPTTATEALKRLGVLNDEGNLVVIHTDGKGWLAEFSPIDWEHRRRLRLGLGAVTDRRLLHALWSLPEGVDLDEAALSDADLGILLSQGQQQVELTPGRVRRTYRPAGSVRSAISTGARAEDVVRRVAALPPIYRRLAIVRSGVQDGTIALARRRGVGLVTAAPDRWKVVVEPRERVLGSPAVYRWWVSELAYESWRYAHCAQWTS